MLYAYFDIRNKMMQVKLLYQLHGVTPSVWVIIYKYLSYTLKSGHLTEF